MPPSLRIDAASRRVRLSPRDLAFVENPYPAYAAIREQCPVFLWTDYGHWCFAAHADVAALFRDRRFGRDVSHVASREALGWPPLPEHVLPFYAVEAHSMLEREPPVHTRLRGLVNRAFVSRAIERLRPRVARLAHALLDAADGDAEVDLLQSFATPIPVTIIAEMLGIPAEMAPQLLDWSHRMVAMYQFGRTTSIEQDAVAATLAFDAYLRGLLPERRRDPGDDVLSTLLAAEAQGDRLGEDELVANAMLLLNAGHEATVHAIGNAIALILSRVLDPSTLLATPASTAAVIEELLRLDPPLHMFTRYALEPVRVAGIDFAVGDKVGLLIGAANRDPSAFPEPDTFDPARPSNPHVGFGGGIHFCIGAPLARMELAVALPILFARWPHLRLAKPPRYADTFHFHGLRELRVTR